jgi:hypothetical protein
LGFKDEKETESKKIHNASHVIEAFVSRDVSGSLDKLQVNNVPGFFRSAIPV